MSAPDALDELVSAVRATARYREIDAALVRQVGAQELAKGRRLKDAVKATRSRLHQVAGAYQEESIDYARWLAELEGLPHERSHPAVKDFCRRMMAQHASTRERLPILDGFYRQTLASLGPLSSLLDVACGLNPLALPWMPLEAGGVYYACDIYADLAAFLNRFFAHLRQPGEAWVCNLAGELPPQQIQLGLALKTIPCLEQLDKQVGRRLLEGLHAPALLVSFPLHSLGGRSKGMLKNYTAHFGELTTGADWQVQRYQFATELAFLVKK